jgi:hypothetical protein
VAGPDRIIFLLSFYSHLFSALILCASHSASTHKTACSANPLRTRRSKSLKPFDRGIALIILFLTFASSSLYTFMRDRKRAHLFVEARRAESESPARPCRVNRTNRTSPEGTAHLQKRSYMPMNPHKNNFGFVFQNNCRTSTTALRVTIAFALVENSSEKYRHNLIGDH